MWFKYVLEKVSWKERYTISIFIWGCMMILDSVVYLKYVLDAILIEHNFGIWFYKLDVILNERGYVEWGFNVSKYSV